MSEYVTKSDKDLIKTLNEKREALRAFHFGLSGSKVKNHKEGRGIRKEIARVMTELNARKASGAKIQ